MEKMVEAAMVEAAMVEAARTRNAREATEEVLRALRSISIPGANLNGLRRILRAPSALVVTDTDFGP